MVFVLATVYYFSAGFSSFPCVWTKKFTILYHCASKVFVWGLNVHMGRFCKVVMSGNANRVSFFRILFAPMKAVCLALVQYQSLLDLTPTSFWRTCTCSCRLYNCFFDPFWISSYRYMFQTIMKLFFGSKFLGLLVKSKSFDIRKKICFQVPPSCYGWASFICLVRKFGCRCLRFTINAFFYCLIVHLMVIHLILVVILFCWCYHFILTIFWLTFAVAWSLIGCLFVCIQVEQFGCCSCDLRRVYLVVDLFEVSACLPHCSPIMHGHCCCWSVICFGFTIDFLEEREEWFAGE